MNAHVLVTGGAGFIGSHAVERLVASGHAVTVLDDLSSGRRDNLASVANHSNFHLIVGDVAAPIAPQLAALPTPPTHILHLAAQVSVVRSLEDPVADMRVNLGGTIEVLRFAEAVGARKVVFASSAAIYGDAPLPVREDTPPAPLSPYGIHKLASEYHLAAAARRGISTLSLRFFNVFGPRQDPKSPYAGVISIFIDRALQAAPLELFDAGRATRDFIYVGDLVLAIEQALFSPDDVTGAINLGTGRETSVRALAEAVLRQTRAASPLIERPPRPGDIVASCAAVERMAAVLNVTAATSLDSGLAATIASLRQR